MNLKEYIKKNRIIPDGSMGTYYSNLINQPGQFSEYANIVDPIRIEQIHSSYLAAGARLLRTNTFAANRITLNMDEKEQTSLVRAACNIAKKAIKSCGFGDEEKERAWILGDIGPIPMDANSDEDEILKEYQLLCDIFMEEEVDGIHFETFSSLHFIELLLPYIKARKPEFFILVSFSLNKNGYTASGISARRLMEMTSQREDMDGIGFNCGVGSGHMLQLLQKLTFPENKLLYAAPNAGYPEQMQNRMIFMDNADYFADNCMKIAELGIDIVGGCCGTTPEYIHNLATRLRHVKNTEAIRRNKEIPVVYPKEIHTNAFYDRLRTGKKVITVELDPPYDANIDKIMECAHALKNIQVDMVTFADSPMGRSRVDSILMSTKIATETGIMVMPHICCRDRNMISMRAVLLGAYIHEIRNLLIVTGDPVPGENRVSTTGVFDYNSLQLMEYVREMNQEHFAQEPFYYGGALNYNRGSVDKVVERMKKKLAAGAKYFLTQPIYTKEDVERIREIKQRVDTKILCGIMPFVSYRNACFVRNEITGIHVPEEIVNRYHPDMTKEEAETVGAKLAIEIMEQLEPIADGYYFMLPFNRVSLMEQIMKQYDKE